MRPEKQALAQEYLERIQNAPFFFLVEYQGLNVAQFTELRRRLDEAEAEIHVIKNRIFRIAAREAGYEELPEELRGQLAVVTGRKDIAAAAKVIKTFASEFEKPKIRFGFLGKDFLGKEQIEQIADLPPMDQLRAQLLATILAPATQLARVIQEPAASLARVIRAYMEKQGGSEG